MPGINLLLKAAIPALRDFDTSGSNVMVLETSKIYIF